MESVSDGCPTGILIDIELQSKAPNYIKKNEDKSLIKSRKDENIVDANTSYSWTSDCFLDQSPPKRLATLKKNEFCTPKSNWKTPSPKSMKIISRDASRIVDRLYSSPLNCAEIMIYDEVFPAVNYLDDDCFDEFHIKSRNQPVVDMTDSPVKSDQKSNNFRTSPVSSCSSESEVVSIKKLSITATPSDMKMEKVTDAETSENAASQESVVSEKEMVKSVTCFVNTSPALPESSNSSSDKLLTSELKVPTHKKLPTFAKGFGIKKTIKNCAENNKENDQSNGTRRAKYGLKFSNTEKSSIENGTKDTKARNNQILEEESIMEQTSTKCATVKYSVLENKKSKENQYLKDVSKNMNVKPEVLQQKANIGRSKSLLYKKDDPLSKTVTLLGTPVIGSPIRRIRSFHDGSSRKGIPTVERKLMPTTESSCRVIKPKMSLNQVSDNGNMFATPLQFGKYSKSSKLADSSSANVMRRKSLAFNPNNSFAASGIKVAVQKEQHSTTKKPAVASSSRTGFGKLNMLPSLPKFKKDNLPRKLFP